MTSGLPSKIVATPTADVAAVLETPVDLFAVPLAGPNFQPNYCGDPCNQQGQPVGCIDAGSSPWRRTICTCSNGYLVC